MIGISMCNVDPGVAVPGSRGPVLGTNPLAYAVPAGKERPVFLDIATSVVAAGKVYAAQAAGKPIPEGWLIDADGLPTTDPAGYPRVGALMPMAGHKGYGICPHDRDPDRRAVRRGLPRSGDQLGATVPRR